MVIARRGSRLMLAALLASLVPLVGCAKGNENSGTGGTTGTGGSGNTGGVGMDSPFYGLPAAKALHVQGNKLVDTTGATVRLLGVNRAGSEYMFSQQPTAGSGSSTSPATACRPLTKPATSPSSSATRTNSRGRSSARRSDHTRRRTSTVRESITSSATMPR